MSDQKRNKTDEILVVDDDLILLEILYEILKSNGYSVRTAFDGNTAMESIKTNPPSLILLDIMIPEPDGYQICLKLKESEVTRDIPVIFLSGLLEPQDKLKAFDYGGVDYITKPFKQKEVLARVAAQINLCEAREEIKEKVELLQQEILERKRAEEELNKHKQRLSELVAERTKELVETNNKLRNEIEEKNKVELEREKLIEDLKEALAKIKSLSGLLPMCASCKKIRNDKGYWEQVETFISNHSEAEFSHSLCPECLKTLYPEIE